jgi:hypothetical protein
MVVELGKRRKQGEQWVQQFQRVEYLTWPL